MNAWPDRRLLDLLGLEVPIIQAPMAGAQDAALAIAVSEAGGLGSLPCALLDVDQIRDELADVLHSVLLLASDLEIDLTGALEQKLAKDAKKYPVDKARGRNTKYDEL